MKRRKTKPELETELSRKMRRLVDNNPDLPKFDKDRLLKLAQELDYKAYGFVRKGKHFKAFLRSWAKASNALHLAGCGTNPVLKGIVPDLDDY